MKNTNDLSVLVLVNIYRSCRNYTKEFLLEAINATCSRNNRPIIEAEAAEHLSIETLARIVARLIFETNTYDESNAEVWIDPDGHYKVPIPTNIP
ncbi:hypothetical protein [Chitinophaga cymbidii]|uniref:hypothetical protein n=1 Tax=Chitinophaga cymbidii TaxID=1096750 RepID=UPI0011BF9E55|nr:hypothetical protein [Chitinophaga cymbidii]